MLCAAQREVQQPGTDGVVGEAVDQDEAAGVAVDPVGIEGDRPIQAQVAHADRIEIEPLGGDVLEGVHVHLVL